VARAYVGLAAFKSAADTCDEAVKIVGADTRLESLLRNLHGISTMGMAVAGKPEDKRLKTAEADFRAALALDETLVIARYNLATALLRQLRDDEGIPELRTFVERAPTTMGEVAEAKRVLENPRRAREAFAPDFSFTSMQGEYISLEELRGKVVLLDFWATWCPPCVAATPSLIRLNKKYADRPFIMLGISADRDRGAWQQYIEKNQTDWPQYFDPGPLRALFQVNSFPTYILVDHEGVIRERKSGWGSDTAAFLDDQIRKRVRAVPSAGGAASGSDLYFPILARPLR
jgi:thiol-disulfide isomerase/thioredoxin